MDKPYSAACDNNREPILSVIKDLFADCRSVLELGSGTGQHAVFFAGKQPHLSWQTSDLLENHEGIKLWLNEARLDNALAPLVLDVTQSEWPIVEVDAVFSANAVHIMGWEAVKAMIAGVGKLISEGGLLVLYGPFNYNNNYSSESNASFDVWLKERNPESGIRDFEEVDRLAKAAGMYLQDDYAMPANNRILCWKKIK
ncbi:MAG: DUF938 domain-containing protein [Gammaproteobacteria bacterium]|jgi:cyclopropane fatty-acyl-phospholipid synthase-like methyltransferase|nr:DUF938 domain-containing protein [Gammaproteobacteria bacterium]